MTANAFEEDKKMAMDAGMNGHVSKPIDVNVLEKQILNILKKCHNWHFFLYKAYISGL